MKLSRAEAKENLAKLVEKFEKETSSGRINDYNEEATKTAFIQPFLRNVLGWNVSNRDEVSPEERTSRGRVDYGLKIQDQIKLFIEVKPPRADLDKHIKQAVGYGYNRKGVPFVLLTDFEGLKLFDVTIKPDTRNPLKGLKIDLDWKEYLSKFDKIWLLSKESVLNGELDKLLLKKPKDRLPVDKAILDDLKKWREKLAKDIFKNNSELFHSPLPSLPLMKESSSSTSSPLMPACAVHADRGEDKGGGANYLKEITQRIIDRIMFMRSCEDRKLIHRRSLRELFEERTEIVGTNTMVFLKEEFKHYNIIFDSDLFRPQDWEANLAIDFKVMKDIILDTYNPYQFDVIPLEVLGNMYEQYLGYTIRLTDHQVKYELKPDVRKAGGVYYTPEYIVDYIVKNTVGKLLQELPASRFLSFRPRTRFGGGISSKTKKLRILDPACGSGSFLIRAYEEMLNYYRSQKKKKSKLKKEQEKLDLEHEIAEPVLTIEEKSKILQEHIFGVDIDEQAVEVTKLSLMLKMLEGEFGIIPGRSILPMLDKNIRCGNSLISGETLELKKYFGDDWYKVKAFNWKDAFRKIMVEEGGFDVVIGNPPYVRIQTLNEFVPEQVKYFNEKYSTYIVGSYDIYLLFIYTGFNLLRKRGSLGYIVPHKFFQAEMGKKIRKYIYQNKSLFKVIDFSTNQIFENATTYTCLLFLTNDVNNKILYKRFNLNDNMENMQNITFDEMDIEILNEKTWVFSTDLARKILGKIYSQKNKFSEITNKIFKGSSTGNDNVFLLNMVKEQNKYYLLFSKQLNKNIKLEKDLLVPFLYGKDIKRYEKPKDRVMLLFPYRYDEKSYKLIPLEELKREYPLTYEYLKSVKDTLLKRKIPLSNANYHKYSASRSLNEYKTPKIMIPDMLVKNRISYDEKGIFFHGPAIHSVIFSDKVKEQHELFYLAILNSNLFWFFISNTSTALRGNAYRLTPEFLNPFCFPEINLKNVSQKLIHDNLVALVDVMLDLNKKIRTARGSRKDQIQRQIEKTDKEIDELVYKLYGITEKERKVIEGKEMLTERIILRMDNI